MKKLQIITIFFLITTISFGQTKRVPKNLKQAVEYLNSDCQEAFKSKVKKVEDSEIKKLSYPWGGEFKTIFEWASNENENSKIVKYLESKEIINYQTEVILIAFKRNLLGYKFDENKILEPFLKIERKIAQEEKIRFTTDTLRGVYIPNDIEDSFRQINTFWADSTKTKLMKLTEDEFSGRLHMGFGMWMRNNWQLWGGSRLSKYFNEKGINHPDDMSGIILNSYYRHLKNQEIKLDEQIQYYKDYWDNSNKNEIARKEKEFSKFNVGDTISFEYKNGFISDAQEKKYDNDSCISKGIVTDINNKDYTIKVRILDTCDKRGIIYYDNDGYRVYDSVTKKWGNPKKHIILKIKKNKEKWFYYEDWEPKE